MPAVTPQFFWFDLMTTDVDSAAQRLAALFGWTILSTGPWRGLAADETMVGSVLPIGDNAQPHWLGQVLVDDVAATCRRTAFLQGEILLEPAMLDGVGKLAVVADPSGAVWSPTQPEVLPTEDVFTGQGRMIWATLLAPRPDLAAKAYKQLLDWKPRGVSPTPHGDVHLLGKRRTPVAGVMALEESQPAQWVPHVQVVQIEATADRASSLGFEVVLPPASVEGVGTLAIFRDPQGALIGAITPID
ncbi:MAG: hypothetical protein ACON4N_11180 [Myxococcota bacterium]